MMYPMNKFKHLSRDERNQIQTLKEAGISVQNIALQLQRSPNTIYYELKKNSLQKRSLYDFSEAHKKKVLRRKNSKFQSMKTVTLCLQKEIEISLRNKYSPDQISGEYKRKGIVISSKSIYKFVYSRSLEYLLFWGWNSKKRGRKSYVYTQENSDKKYIDKRKEEITHFDYEMDFIVSSLSSFVLLVLVNRISKKAHIYKLPNRKKATVNRFLSLFCTLYKVESITTDNDIAFSHWKELESQLQCSIYFTFPYHSWEKGLVENCNRWIRCFIKKRSDIALATPKQIKNALSFLNERPSEVLKWKTRSVYDRELRDLVV